MITTVDFPKNNEENRVSADFAINFKLILKHTVRTSLVVQWIGGFPGGSDGRESTCSAGDLGSIPGPGRSPGGVHGNTL